MPNGACDSIHLDTITHLLQKANHQRNLHISLAALYRLDTCDECFFMSFCSDILALKVLNF